MTTKNGIGVVIGRFQTYELHGGHLAVLNAANEHQDLLIFVGVCPSLGTKNDPLDFFSRKTMLQEEYPLAMILPLPNQDTDEGWTNLIDSQTSLCFPLRPSTIYFGRRSAVDHYTPTGKCKQIRVVKEVEGVTGEDRRARAKGEVGRSAEWRKGVIYSAHNQYPQVTPVVDVCVTRKNESPRVVRHPYVEVLVGKRNSEGGKYRFPGGHVDLSDGSYEETARREVYEETNGCETSNYRVLGSLNVDSKYKAADRAMMTTVFRCDYMWGQPKGTDDIDHLEWVHVADLQYLKWADDHESIAALLIMDVMEQAEKDYVEKAHTPDCS